MGFFNALNMQPIDKLLQLKKAEKPFQVAKGESAQVDWRIVIPQGLEAITYRIVASAGSFFSDGEEMAIPVLPNRMLVTEAIQLPIRAEQKKGIQLRQITPFGKKAKVWKITSLRLSLLPIQPGMPFRLCLI